MICKACTHNKEPQFFHQYEPGRYRKTCKACRRVIERRKAQDARRDEFCRLLGWPVP